MAQLNTSIRGQQIRDAFFGLALKRNVADNDIMDLDLSELSSVVVDVANDEIAIIDASDGSSKKEAIADLITGIAGNGLSSASGVLALDLNELSDTAIDVANDSFAFLDNDDSGSKRDTIADFITAIAGTGLTATAGVLSVDAITDNIVEGDIQFEDESANCNGVTVNFTLSNTPITNSVQVFLNGLLQQEGSGKDYTLTGTTVAFVTAPETGDLLLIHYIINN